MDELSRMKENLYKEGSPVVVQAGVLYTEGEGKAASLTFRSLSDKPITSVLIDLHIFDRANIEVEVVRDYLYLVDEAERDREFGGDTHIEVTNAAAVSMAVAVRRVAFGEDELWDGSNSIWFECIPPRRTVEEELEDEETVAQYRRDFTENFAKKKDVAARFVPAEYKNLWLCACGEMNFRSEDSCYSCGARYLPQRSHLDNRVQIAANLTAHKKALADKAEQERLERERKAAEAVAAKAEQERLAAEEQLRQEQKAKRIRRTKITALAISIPLVIAAAVFIVVLNVYLIPQGKYNAAKALLEEGKLDQAVTAFSAMNGYADSADMVVEAKFRQAEAYLEDGNYEEALARYEAIAKDRDVSARVSEAKYRQAGVLLEEMKYEEALALYEETGDYEDSGEKVALCRFQLAKKHAVAVDLPAAKPYFETLTGSRSVEVQEIFLVNGRALYEKGSREEGSLWFQEISDDGLKAQVNAVYYAGALQNIEAKQYEEARVALTALGDYQDSAEQLLRIEYILAEEKLEAGTYEEAIALYEKAGAYSDAAEKIKECRYRMAKDVLNAGEYSAAIEQLNALEGYSDSASLALEAQYQMGVAQLNSGQVMDAYRTLYAIKGYGPAFALLVSNSQFYIHVYDVGNGSNPLDE